jgi:tRNA modification GTPase
VNDTIVAVSSAPGKVLRGIIRLSGPEAFARAAAVFRGGARPAGRAVLFGEVDGGDGLRAPGQVLVMPGPRSYTREEIVEIHTYAAPPLLARLVARLVAAGARPAEPGEFTLRAFLNGRIDLLQAEAVAALIEARGEAEFRHAQRALAGATGEALAAAREALLGVRARLEAELDFPEEEDVRFLPSAAARAAIRRVREDLAGMRASAPPRRERLRIVLAGRENAGKSTLFNALIARAHAIVHEDPGTTLDAVTAEVFFGAAPCTLVDTAGSGAGGGPLVEAAARARERALADADVTVGVVDISAPDARAAFADLRAARTFDVLVGAKVDLLDAAALQGWGGRLVPVSAATGRGMELLRGALAAAAAGKHDSGALAGARQEHAFARALEALARAEDEADRPELCAAELRAAEGALGEILGEGLGGDVLGRIFERFCVGK